MKASKTSGVSKVTGYQTIIKIKRFLYILAKIIEKMNFKNNTLTITSKLGSKCDKS